MNACIIYIFTCMHAYVYFTLYYFMCIYYKRLHYSCCDITSFFSSSSLASMAVLGRSRTRPWNR